MTDATTEKSRRFPNVQPEILQADNKSDRTRFGQVVAAAEARHTDDELFAPIRSQYRELEELKAAWQDMPVSPDRITEKLADALHEMAPAVDRQKIADLYSRTTIPTDLGWLIGKVREETDENKISREARLITFPSDGTSVVFASPGVDEILLRSRFLGLVPFETLRKHADTHYVSAGTSADMEALYLMVACGAKNIVMVDGGFIDRSNATRLPPYASGVNRIGWPKSLTLADLMYRIQPYGSFKARVGRVIPDGTHPSPGDMPFSEFAREADIGFEVIDHTPTKIGIQEYLREAKPDLPVVFLADTSWPHSAIVTPGKNDPFNQQMPVFAREAMHQPLPPKERYRELVKRLGSDVLWTLDHDIEPDHLAEILGFASGVIPFWSQHGISAHESAAVTVRLILGYLRGDAVTDRNVHPDTVPRSLVDMLPAEQADTAFALSRALREVS